VVKHFETEAERPTEQPADDRFAPLLFTLSGNAHIYVASPPKRSIWQRAVSAGRPNVPVDRAEAAFVDFVNGTLTRPADSQHLADRLLSGADPLDTVDLLKVVRYLSTRWVEQGKDPAVRDADQAEYDAWAAGQTRPLVTVDAVADLPEGLGDDDDDEVPVAQLVATKAPAAVRAKKAPAKGRAPRR